MPACVMSDAVTVLLPDVVSVTLKLWVPASSAALPGNAAFPSLDVIPPVSFVPIKFQLASTALTVTVKAAPAVWAIGVPVLPARLPGEAVSPGASSCSLEKAPGFTVMAGLVKLVLLPSVVSVAVTVQLPAVLFVRLKVRVPAARAVLGGSTAFGSDEVSDKVSETEVTWFQLASTALTVTVEPVPAVSPLGVPVLPVAVA